jgi:hypothetical protein
MVIAASFAMGTTGRAISQAFQELGWCVHEVEARTLGAGDKKDFSLRAAARLLRPFVRQAYLNAIQACCAELRPDVFLAIKGANLTAELLSKIRNAGTKTVMFYPDFHFDYFNVDVKSFRQYDLFVTTKTFQVEHLKRMLPNSQIEYVAHGYCMCHKPEFGELLEDDYSLDVLYAGSQTSYKKEWLERSLDDALLKSGELVGKGWHKYAKNGRVASLRVVGERTGLSYARKIQTAKINIAIHMGPHRNGWQDYVSTRTFEIPACKGFMLHIDNQEVREFFEPGKEIDVFTSPEELREKIKYYLPRPAVRKRMIERAFARCKTSYSYKSRANEINKML